jgi:hypothetical protein
MRSTGARIGLLVVAVAVAVALFVVLSDDDGDGDGGDRGGANTTATVAARGDQSQGGGVPTIELANGAPVGGVRDLTYSQGDRVRFRVLPEPGVVEIHVHGYEIEQEVSGTQPVTVSFTAEIAGGFEIEAHSADDEFEIAELRVNP